MHSPCITIPSRAGRGSGRGDHIAALPRGQEQGAGINTQALGALRGPLLMLAATAVLTCMHATVRHVSDGMHGFEITLFRNLFGLFTILPLAIRAGETCA